MSELQDAKTLLMMNLTKNPIPEKKLARHLGITDRMIRLAIVDLIENDRELILSDSHGIWREENPQIVIDYCNRIQAIGMAYMKKQADLKKNVMHKFPQLGFNL